MKNFLLTLFGIFLLVEFIGLTALSVVELNGLDYLAIVLGGLIGVLIASPVVWIITHPFIQEEEKGDACPKGGEHQWGTASEITEGPLKGWHSQNCLKCDEETLIRY